MLDDYGAGLWIDTDVDNTGDVFQPGFNKSRMQFGVSEEAALEADAAAQLMRYF